MCDVLIKPQGSAQVVAALVCSIGDGSTSLAGPSCTAAEERISLASYGVPAGTEIATMIKLTTVSFLPTWHKKRALPPGLLDSVHSLSLDLESVANKSLNIGQLTALQLDAEYDPDYAALRPLQKLQQLKFRKIEW